MSTRHNEMAARPDQPADDSHKTVMRQEGVATGVGIGLASIAPLLIGVCTMVYTWPVLPFNLSLALFIVVCVAATLNYRFTDLWEQREQHQEQYLVELERLRSDIKRAIKHGQRDTYDAVTELRVELMSRDIPRNIRSIGS